MGLPPNLPDHVNKPERLWSDMSGQLALSPSILRIKIHVQMKEITHNSCVSVYSVALLSCT